jgi:hypothetical protein
MGLIVPLIDPYDRVRVHRRIKRLLAEGEIQIHPHAQKRMRERNILTPDILNVLKYGTITEITPSGSCWRYRLEEKTVEQKSLGCVVEINGRMLIVTAFEIGRWTR